MGNELSRKQFLYAAGALGLSALACKAAIPNPPDKSMGVELDFDGKLSFKESWDLATRLDALTDRLVEPKESVHVEEMLQLALEAVPNFQYEGFVKVPVYPNAVRFQAFLDGRAHNHILGVSDCAGIYVNYRYTNPQSKLYEDSGWKQTVIHELAHVQQGALCETEDKANLENTAQIASWEVMAGMLNGGNGGMIYPLIDELRSAAMGATHAIALREGHDYNSLRKQLDNSAAAEARFNKSMRFWENDMKGLQYVLSAYAETPLNRVVDAIVRNNDVAGQLRMPNREAKVDDLAYFLKNTESIINYWAKN